MAFEIEHGILEKYIPEDGETEVVIPEGVTRIGDDAFIECKSLTSVTIPESVTSIEFAAFCGCSSLTSVTISEGVTSIGHFAFEYCDSLTSVTIPEGVTSIGFRAVNRCCNLTSITIPTSVTSIEPEAFSETPWLKNYLGDLVIINGILLEYKGKDTAVVIPEDVKSIGSYAFEGCSSLTSVTISEGVTTIGEGAFCECRSLTSMTLPKGVTNIGKEAFYKCGSLTSVMLSEGVTTIGEGAFRECSGLTSVTIPETVTTIGEGAFCECRRLTSVTIPEGVTRIGAGAFHECRSLTSVTMYGITIPLEIIGDNDFHDAMEMLKTKDFSMELNTDIKHVAAVGHWLKTSDPDAERYITEHLDDILPFLIKNHNLEIIQKLLDSGKIIKKENIDKCIEYAIAHTQNGGSPEIQMMLMHYKLEVLGYEDSSTAIKL